MYDIDSFTDPSRTGLSTWQRIIRTRGGLMWLNIVLASCAVAGAALFQAAGRRF